LKIQITVDYYAHLGPPRRRLIVNWLDDGGELSVQSAETPGRGAGI
jgi:hypothetical protein